jgi:HEAT repeat protein
LNGPEDEKIGSPDQRGFSAVNNEWNLELEARTREAQNDPRATHELIALALMEPDDEAAWDAVTTLHYRASKDVFDAACQLCGSDCPQERTLGTNILGQLGIPTRNFPEQSVAVLLKLLKVENDEDILRAICVALGHIHEPTAIRALARFKTHPSASIRYAVVFGLLAFEEDLAINTLIELTRDQSDLVRDWATFGLGSQIEGDTPQIREALFARLFDADDIVRGEALVGLARRKDERVIEPLIQELARYPAAKYGSLPIEAAEEIADTRLLPALMRLKQSSGAATFDEAIRCCSE